MNILSLSLSPCSAYAILPICHTCLRSFLPSNILQVQWPACEWEGENVKIVVAEKKYKPDWERERERDLHFQYAWIFLNFSIFLKLDLKAQKSWFNLTFSGRQTRLKGANQIENLKKNKWTELCLLEQNWATWESWTCLFGVEHFSLCCCCCCCCWAVTHWLTTLHTTTLLLPQQLLSLNKSDSHNFDLLNPTLAT